MILRYDEWQLWSYDFYDTECWIFDPKFKLTFTNRENDNDDNDT